LIVRAEDTLLGKTVEVPADLVVLATGVQPRADAGQVADMLGLEFSEDGFFAELHPELRPVDTSARASSWPAPARRQRISPIPWPRPRPPHRERSWSCPG